MFLLGVPNQIKQLLNGTDRHVQFLSSIFRVPYVVTCFASCQFNADRRFAVPALAPDETTLGHFVPSYTRLRGRFGANYRGDVMHITASGE